MNTLIDVNELVALQSQKAVRIFDCRFSLMDTSAGANAYQQSHIPGATYMDMNKDLSTPHIPGKTGRHPLPDKADWLDKVQELGLKPETQVVVYDDAGGASAARMWWMLRWAGHEKVAVLNGGWQAWLAAGQEQTDEIQAKAPADVYDYRILPSLTHLITAEQIDGDQQLLVDARELARFNGEVEPIDPVAGHIPGAICLPFGTNLNEQGLFKSRAELLEKFAATTNTDKPVVCYCGSGVTAAHNILAMVHAGLPEPTLYAGSWSDWITDSQRKIAKGK